MFAYFIYIIAGMGAGIGTGLAGLSAAAVISPMLITFLGFDPYEAVGISLASDVLASAISAYTYGKNKNLDIKNGLVMLASVLVFTLIGSYIASLVPGGTMGSFSVFMTLLLGIKFIVRPVMTTKEAQAEKTQKEKNICFQKEVISQYAGEVHSFFSNDCYQEIVPEGISKGFAVRWFCDYLGIPIENSVAAGDAQNDVEMLKAAHVGAVMCNAFPGIAEYGNYVTEHDNNHDGVAEIIHKFILKDA